MRIAVIGAGALGTTFAALLSRAGHDVEVTARPDAVPVIAHAGIHLTGGFGEFSAPVAASARVSVRPEVVLLCTKAHDAEQALLDNAAMIAGSPIIVVQNGLEGIDVASRALPASECFGALTIIAASYLGPGRATVTAPALTYLGRGSGPADNATAHWSAVLNAALPTEAIDNFVGSQWSKLIINQLNALPAITGLSVQEVIADPALASILTRGMQETVRVGRARGIRFGSLQGMTDAKLREFADRDPASAEALPRRMVTAMGDVPNPGSTLQSIRRGKRTEVDYLNGVVVREAEAAGVTARINAVLTRLVHRVEDSGKFLPVDAVVTAVAAA